MEQDTPRAVSDDLPERTIVIPQEVLDSPSSGKLEPGANPGAAPDGAGAESGPQGSRRSILEDLGNFIFPRRSVVDDTIELIRAGGGDEEAPAVIRDNTAPLTDVSGQYAVAPQAFATGGQGRISKAVDRVLGCEIAMKSLHEKFRDNDHARNNFLNEAKLTAVLDHPSIIPIHGLFGDAHNGMHLAMKLIDGHTLSSYLANIIQIYEKKGISRFDERKSLRNRIEIFLKVCDAMEYAHSRKIIHRDLKLENIMIGKHRETYVTDWGLAMRLEDARTLKKVDGTPGFIAPEVLLSRKADVRSDIYSLGIILFELTALTPAFPDTTLPNLLTLVKRGQLLPLRHRFKCRIDADLKAIILKAVRFDPDKRYQKVSELSEDMRRYLTNEETSARPDNLFGKICRWSVNHRRGMLFTTMFLLLLGVGGIARTLHKEIRWSTERRLRDNAISAVYSDATGNANELEKDLEKIEYQLEQLRMHILFSTLRLHAANPAEQKFFVPLTVYNSANPPVTLADSPAYRHPIDPDGACVFNYRDGRIDWEELKFFGNTAQFMREALLDPQKIGEAEAKVRLLQDGRPIKKIYFLLADGTFVCYPGSKDDFPPDYFPPGRPWYQRAEQGAGRPVWSGPYRDSGRYGDAMLTCTTAVYGAERKFLGMAAIDYSLTKLAEKMLGAASKHPLAIREKMLINPDGEVIFRMVPSNRPAGRPFADPALIRRMLAMKYGTLLTWDAGREMLLAFSYLNSIDVLYVEYLELDRLIEQQRAAAGFLLPEEASH